MSTIKFSNCLLHISDIAKQTTFSWINLGILHTHSKIYSKRGEIFFISIIVFFFKIYWYDVWTNSYELIVWRDKWHVDKWKDYFTMVTTPVVANPSFTVFIECSRTIHAVFDHFFFHSMSKKNICFSSRDLNSSLASHYLLQWFTHLLKLFKFAYDHMLIGF